MSIVKEDIGYKLLELERSLYYCNRLLLDSDRLGRNLPITIEFPALLQDSIIYVAKSVVNEWKQLQDVYVFVIADFKSDILAGVSYPIFLTRVGYLTKENIIKEINDEKLVRISDVQFIQNIFIDEDEDIHDEILKLLKE